MRIKDFEKEIQRDIDKDLTIVWNLKGAPDVSGVHYNGMYIGVTLPAHEIMDVKSQFHADKNGIPFRGRLEAKKLIATKLSAFTSEKKKLFYDDKKHRK